MRDAAQTGYIAAARRLYKRRHAVATGRPASVTCLGFAIDTIYDNGMVCMLEHSQVRTIDLHGMDGVQTLSFESLMGNYARVDVEYDWESFQILSIHQSRLVFRYKDEAGVSWLMAADVTKPHDVHHIIEPERLRSTKSLFVLQSEDYIFYGTRSATADWCTQSYREWLIQGIALNGKEFTVTDEDGVSVKSTRSEKIQLHGFAGADIGTTAAFKLHDGHLYGVTNYDAFDVIEVDFTSYYHCIRFSLAEARQDACEQARTIFRRQHIDGPLNDGWNTINLQIDERTNDLVILEGRAEWPCGSGQLSRGVYAHKLNWNGLNLESVKVKDQTPRGPASDPLSRIPDLETKYTATPELPSWHDHIEDDHVFLATQGKDSRSRGSLTWPFPREVKGARVPELRHSMHRSYNFSTMTSQELVLQPCSCRPTQGFCLQLKSASRKFQPGNFRADLDIKGKAKMVGSQGATSSRAARSSVYKYSPTVQWPDFDENIHEIMNLPASMQENKSLEMKAWSDERCVVYMISAGNGIGKVVCINFDGDAPVAGLPHATMPVDLMTCRPRGRSPRNQSEPEHTRQISPPRAMFEYPVFDPGEMPVDFMDATDLDDVLDADQLDVRDLNPWFDSFGKDVEMLSC